jgi:hypothetical protein
VSGFGGVGTGGVSGFGGVGTGGVLGGLSVTTVPPPSLKRKKIHCRFKFSS